MDNVNYTPPGKVAAKFHNNNSFVRGLLGPVGCLAPNTLVVTEFGVLPIAHIDRPMRVLSWNEKTCRFQLSWCGGSFPKGTDYLYRVTTPQGEFAANEHHLVYDGSRAYQRAPSIESVTLYSGDQSLTSLAHGLLMSQKDDQRSRQIAEGSLASYATSARQYGQQLLLEEGIDLEFVQKRNDARTSFSHHGSFASSHTDGLLARLLEHTRHGLYAALSCIDGLLRPAAPLRLTVEGSFGEGLCGRFEGSTQGGLQSLLMNDARRIERRSAEFGGDCSAFDLGSVSERPIVSIEQESVKRSYWDMQVIDTNNYVTADGTIHHNSGKSSTCCVEIVARALAQNPYKGVRRSRWVIIRNTYPELKSTTIKTWQTWFPDNVAPMKWDTPITSTMNIADIGDGTSLELEVMFMALDKATETGKLRSLELTGGWINEASEVPKEIFDMLTQRVGRYPSKIQGGPSWYGVIMDTNPPDDDSWYYNIAENETPDDWKFFRQAGGLYRSEAGEFLPNPDAENIFNLANGHTYYLNQVPGKTDDWINVFLLGNYGTTADGKPVYPEWKDKIHVATEPLEPVRGLPILLGWDFGLTPACVVMQITPRGQVLILKEIVSEDMGIRQFANEVVKPILINQYPDFNRFSVGDPSGNIRVQTDERTVFQELLEAGIPTEPAPTNDFLPRREAVAYFLTRMADGEPGFILDPSCRQLRRGFNGRYRFERLKTSGPARFRDRPYKDEHSHIHDALQYACLKIRSGLNPVRAKTLRKKSAKGWT